MKVNMNGIRINLARAYNGLFEDSPCSDDEYVEVSRDRLAEMWCEMVGAFMCLYSDNKEMRDLSKEIRLRDPYTGEWSADDEE